MSGNEGAPSLYVVDVGVADTAEEDFDLNVVFRWIAPRLSWWAAAMSHWSAEYARFLVHDFISVQRPQNGRSPCRHYRSLRQRLDDQRRA
jgi:hypothetical protein